MLGYVTPDKPELKIKEFEMYSAYYCGVCKSIGRRYGQMPRLALSYDSVLLALILAGINPKIDNIKIERCIVHPLKKRSIVYDSAEIDYASDILLLLAYFKLKDDYQDDKELKAAIGTKLMNGVYKKLMQNYNNKCAMIQDKLEELSALEKEKCPSIDKSAEPFAKLMEEVFDSSDSAKAHQFCDENQRTIYRRIGYHLGKWIYLVDAYDDIEANSKSGSYNPLIYQFDFNPDRETADEFRNRIRERVEMNLMCYLAEVAECCSRLKFEKNQGLIDNIIYLGLLRKTEEILMKGNTKNAESI